MGFSVEVFVAAVVSFFLGYYVGWFAHRKWEEKKGAFAPAAKSLKKVKKSKNLHWSKTCAGCVDEFKTDPTERWCVTCTRSRTSGHKSKDHYKEKKR